jgi:putative colanic acid biosynthesis acetyltransferase WcaF
MAHRDSSDFLSDSGITVIPLKDAPGERSTWDRSKFVVYAWAACEILFIHNPWQISSSIRVRILRAFGADIGHGVVFRPRTRVKFPWKLRVGNDCWIGEGVWFHNQDHVFIGHDVVISQETFITTGSHAIRKDMALITRPVRIESGAWVTARCILLGGAHIGRSAVLGPGSVVSGVIPENTVWKSADSTQPSGFRFPQAG